jgi:hypothetical protein
MRWQLQKPFGSKEMKGSWREAVTESGDETVSSTWQYGL